MSVQDPVGDLVFNTGTPTLADTKTNGTSGAALGGLAGRLEAGLRRLEADSRRTFTVPGWPDMRLVARKVRDDERDQGDTTVATIALATAKLEMRDDHDEWQEVPHAWRGIATLMGDDTLSTTDVIRRVLDNGARLDAFALQIVAWMIGRESEIEQALGG